MRRIQKWKAFFGPSYSSKVTNYSQMSYLDTSIWPNCVFSRYFKFCRNRIRHLVRMIITFKLHYRVIPRCTYIIPYCRQMSYFDTTIFSFGRVAIANREIMKDFTRYSMYGHDLCKKLGIYITQIILNNKWVMYLCNVNLKKEEHHQNTCCVPVGITNSKASYGKITITL